MTLDYSEASRTPSERVQRRLIQWRNTAPVRIAPATPIISFTFDNFPQSALNGADILETRGARGGFFAATSQMGRRSPLLGDMFCTRDLVDLRARGHEVGAHTHTHRDCSRASPEVVTADIIANLSFLKASGGVPDCSAFAYPFGATSPAIKALAAERFHTARGALPGINRGSVDRAQLRAVLITSSEESRRRAVAAIEACVRLRGWLVFFTHDVRSAPSLQGISLRHLSELVQRARDSGAAILAPTEAADRCGIASPVRASNANRALVTA